MKTCEKIRLMRENKRWSQEEVANKLNMSANGYAKIERGETRLNLPRLEQIAEIFETDIFEFIRPESGWHCHIGDNNIGDNNSDIAFYNHADQELNFQIERLNLIIQHQKELLQQKDNLLIQQAEELASLKEIIDIIKSKI